MRLYEIESPISFVDKKVEWESAARGKLILFDNRGLTWPFVLEVIHRGDTLRLSWWPSTSQDGDDVALRISRYHERYGDIGLSESIGNGLLQVIRELARNHPEVEVFQLNRDAPHVESHADWKQIARKMGMRASLQTDEITLTRSG